MPDTARRRSDRGRRSRAPDLGQHFLASDALAARIVDDAGIGRRDRVVEPGAGTGVLTAALAARSASVLASEIDARLAAHVAARFADLPHVTVLNADATSLPRPLSAYRVVGNPAFNSTAALLRHLLDHPSHDSEHGLVRVDLVVQWQVARHRATVTDDLLGATWAPWWEFRRGRRLPAALFRPAPSVDAGVIVVQRRPDPMLDASEFGSYSRFVREALDRAGGRLRLDVDEWVARYRTTR